ncbi:hypothetical protein Ancab_006255, partial [Ancistrocladus abbreviatus]
SKQHFWAMITGLPWDIQLPDPDMYSDEIDWDPHIDLKLIQDLDWEYFAPDENENDGRVEDYDAWVTLRSGLEHDQGQDDGRKSLGT